MLALICNFLRFGQEADDNMETLFVAPRGTRFNAEKLQTVGPVVTLDDAVEI